MTDEATNVDKPEEIVCECVRWHSPRGPVVLLGDTPVCLVTEYVVRNLLEKHRAKGKVVKADQKGATKYQRELAERLFASETSEPAVPAVASPELSNAQS